MTLTQLFTAIANAIRAKKGTSGTITASDFPTEISSISTGITPTGTINITQNGTTDVTNYANANVNVPTPTPSLQSKSVTITENGTQTITPDSGYDGLNEVEVTTNVSGGEIEEKAVNFYDYDGTLVDSYSKTDFLALSAMPVNPSHDGLIAQGWNWSLADAKDYVTEYGVLDVGQMYTTTSGLSEFDIELTQVTGLEVTLNMNGTKDWGDGTTDDLTTHTYSTTGKYTIKCNGTSIPSTIFGQSSSSKNCYAVNIKLANVINISSSAFQNCYSLTNIIIPDSVTSINDYAFQNCYSLTNITIPDRVTSINNYAFSGCSSLTNIEIPSSVTGIGNYAFQNCYSLTNITIPDRVTRIGNYAFSGCSSLTNIEIPSSVTSIKNNTFQNCYSVFSYDFSNVSSIPTLSATNVFSEINQLAKIIVPDNLYEDWIVATNWSNYAGYIVKASEV